MVLSAFLGKQSYEWLISTGFYKDRMFDLGFNAAGALAIGLGVLPVVAGLAILWPAPGETRTRSLDVFRAVLLASLVAFGLYTSVKSTYVSTTFGTYTYERNLIYLAPLLFTGTAIWLERRRIHPVALAVSAAFVLFLLLTTPYEMDQDISYNAPGLAILQQANRYLRLDATGARIGLLAILTASVLLLLSPRFLPRAAAWIAVGVGAAVVAWNLTGEVVRVRIEPDIRPLRREHPRAHDVGGRQHGRRADALHRSADAGSERRMAAGVLEPLDQGCLEPRRHGPGARPVPHARPVGEDGALSHDPGYP